MIFFFICQKITYSFGTWWHMQGCVIHSVCSYRMMHTRHLQWFKASRLQHIFHLFPQPLFYNLLKTKITTHNFETSIRYKLMELCIKFDLIEKKNIYIYKQIEEVSSVSPIQLQIFSNNHSEGDYKLFLHLPNRKCPWEGSILWSPYILRSQKITGKEFCGTNNLPAINKQPVAMDP